MEAVRLTNGGSCSRANGQRVPSRLTVQFGGHQQSVQVLSTLLSFVRSSFCGLSFSLLILPFSILVVMSLLSTDNLTDWYTIMDWVPQYGQLACHSRDTFVWNISFY